MRHTLIAHKLFQRGRNPLYSGIAKVPCKILQLAQFSFHFKVKLVISAKNSLIVEERVFKVCHYRTKLGLVVNRFVNYTEFAGFKYDGAIIYYIMWLSFLQTGVSITKWGKHYYKIVQLHVITKRGRAIKVGQVIYYKAPLQSEVGITKRGNFTTNWGKHYYKVGQLLQSRAKPIIKKGKVVNYKVGQVLKNGESITKQDSTLSS